MCLAVLEETDLKMDSDIFYKMNEGGEPKEVKDFIYRGLLRAMIFLFI